MDIILASNNQGKIKEFKKILAPFGFNVLSLADINYFDEIVEDGTTFFENALIKAKTIYEYTKTPVISDDSGICVDYLNGEPGVYSARYHNLFGDKDRNLLILKLLEGQTLRTAHFHCTIVLYMGEGNYKSFDGEVYGKIDYEEKGTNGFGYDSIFIPDGYDMTFGLLDSSIKDEISHRAKAIKLLVRYLEDDFNN